MLKFPVGPFVYGVELVKGHIEVDGKPALGTCDSDRQLIRISDVPPPGKWVAVFWHELAHAWRGELDIWQGAVLADEPLANLIGIAMAWVNVVTLARLQIYLVHGIECDEILMLSGHQRPIPLLRPEDAPRD